MADASAASEAMRMQLENQLAFQAGAQAEIGLPQHSSFAAVAALLGQAQQHGLSVGDLAATRERMQAMQNMQAQAAQQPLGGPLGNVPGPAAANVRPLGGPQASSSSSFQQQQEDSRQAAAAKAKAQREEREQREEQARKKAALMAQAEKLKCHLHKKPNKACKFCKRHQEFQASMVEKDEGAGMGKEVIKGAAFSFEDIRNGRVTIEIVNKKTFGLSPLLQSHITESKHYKELIKIDSFDQLVQETYQYADGVEPYMTSNVDSITPSPLFSCLYRFFTANLDCRQLCKLVEYGHSAYVRCVGFLFIRFALAPDQLWPWLGEFVLDTEELWPSKDSEVKSTIGEFVESLLIEDKYYSVPLPRLPMSAKRQLEAKLAPIAQYRKRGKSNLALTDVYSKRGINIEACPNGTWISGTTLELVDEAPSRMKIRVQLEGHGEEVIHLGKVILTDRRYAGYGRPQRTQSRSRSPHIDWAREKGRTDADLVDEMRSKDRDKAVATGKDYAKKPIGFKKACALPREQGAASYRLMEEETYISDRYSRKRLPSPEADRAGSSKAPSAEHRAKMQQIFEKYGMAKTQESSRGPDDLDQSAVLRFG